MVDCYCYYLLVNADKRTVIGYLLIRQTQFEMQSNWKMPSVRVCCNCNDSYLYAIRRSFIQSLQLMYQLRDWGSFLRLPHDELSPPVIRITHSDLIAINDLIHWDI